MSEKDTGIGRRTDVLSIESLRRRHGENLALAYVTQGERDRAPEEFPGVPGRSQGLEVPYEVRGDN
jgi:hypothetical protein